MKWHKQTVRSLLCKKIKFSKNNSIFKDFKDMSDMWAAPYDDGTKGWTAKSFKKEMKGLWGQLKPNYSILHDYVRMKLRASNKVYVKKIKRFGYLHANILGNMWSQVN